MNALLDARQPVFFTATHVGELTAALHNLQSAGARILYPADDAAAERPSNPFHDMSGGEWREFEHDTVRGATPHPNRVPYTTLRDPSRFARNKEGRQTLNTIKN